MYWHAASEFKAEIIPHTTVWAVFCERSVTHGNITMTRNFQYIYAALNSVSSVPLSSAGYTLDDCQILTDFKNVRDHRYKDRFKRFFNIIILQTHTLDESYRPPDHTCHSYDFTDCTHTSCRSGHAPKLFFGRGNQAQNHLVCSLLKQFW